MVDAESYPQQLARALTWRENVLITLSSVTPASSLFIIVPVIIAGLAGASVVAMAAGAVLAVFVGLSYADLATRLPIAGSEYSWAARMLGKPVGAGVFLLCISGVFLILAVIVSGVGAYLGVVWSGFDSPLTAIVVLAVTTMIASLAIRINAWVTGVCLALEILAVLVIVALGFANLSRGPQVLLEPAALQVGSPDLAPVAWVSVWLLIPTALFAFGGYGSAAYFAEETKSASSTIRRVILWSLCITVLVEIIPMIAIFLGTSSVAELVRSPKPLNHFLLDRGGETVNLVVSAGIAVAVFNAVIAIQIQAARLVFASARDRSWPVAIDNQLGAVRETSSVPVRATLFVGIATACAAWFLPFHVLVTATGANGVMVYLVVGASALKMHWADRKREGARIIWAAVPPVIVLISMAYILIDLMRNGGAASVMVAVVTIVAGSAWYYAFINRSGSGRWLLPRPPLEL